MYIYVYSCYILQLQQHANCVCIVRHVQSTPLTVMEWLCGSDKGFKAYNCNSIFIWGATDDRHDHCNLLRVQLVYTCDQRLVELAML